MSGVVPHEVAANKKEGVVNVHDSHAGDKSENHDDGEHEHEHSPWMKIYEYAMMVLLVFSLYIGDGWEYGNYSEHIAIRMNVLIPILMLLFYIEIVVDSIEDRAYFLSKFFWIDIFGTAVLLLEMPVIAAYVTSGKQAQLLRATRVTKIGMRAKEISKLIGSIGKLVRLLKLYLAAGQEIVHHHMKEYYIQFRLLSDLYSANMESIAYRVAGITMAMMFALPFLAYYPKDTAPDAWALNFRIAADMETVTVDHLELLGDNCLNFFEDQSQDLRLHELKVFTPYIKDGLYEMTVHSSNYINEENLLEYEIEYEIENFDLKNSGNAWAKTKYSTLPCLTPHCGVQKFKVQVAVDNTIPFRMTAIYNMSITTLVVVVLFGFTSSFMKLTLMYLIKPIEETFLEYVDCVNHEPALKHVI